MNPHRRKVLEMLKEGKISPEEADQLLEKLETPNEEDVVVEDDAEAGFQKAFAGVAQKARHAARAAVAAVAKATSRPGEPRYFRIEIQSHQGDEVNVRLPSALLRAGVKFGALLPDSAQQAVTESGLNLEELGKLEGEELIDALREIDIEVQTKQGDEIHIYCE